MINIESSSHSYGGKRVNARTWNTLIAADAKPPWSLTLSPGFQPDWSYRGGATAPASAAPIRESSPAFLSAHGSLYTPGTDAVAGGRSPRFDGASRTTGFCI